MNTTTLNMTTLDGGVIIKKGGGGTSPAPMPSAPIAENDVTFYDYDGKVLYAYTKEEFLALTAMPPLPTREGLICQEWNWTWEEAYDYVSKYGICMIGATYTTDDGATRVYVYFPHKDALKLETYLQLVINEDSEIAVDWGDGSPIETYNESDYTNIKHAYSTIGEHCISIKPIKGSFEFSWYGNYMQQFTKLHFGSCVEVGSYSLNSMENLTEIIFPSDMLHGDSIYYGNAQITCLVVPRSCIQFWSLNYGLVGLKYLCLPPTSEVFPRGLSNADKGFHGVYSRIMIPPLVTEIPDDAFSGDCMCKCIIPDSITKIGYEAFYNQYSLLELDFSHFTHVPTLSGKLFADYQDTKIIVPDNLYYKWINATNWSALADRIVTKSGVIPTVLGVGVQHIDGTCYTKDEWIANGYTNEEANGVAFDDGVYTFVISKSSLGLSVLAPYLISSAPLGNDDGVGNTNSLSKNDNSTAANNCIAYTFPNGAEGYLPAINEWSQAYSKKSEIVDVMTLIGGDLIVEDDHWSSTCPNLGNGKVLSWANGTATNKTVGTEAYVRAFAPLIK